MGPRESLNTYLEQVRDKAFVWGKHDCLTFSNNAFHAMYGRGWADDWLGRYMVHNRPMRKKELIKEFGRRDFYGAIDERLACVGHVPPLGALVATKEKQRWIIGAALGVCTGNKAVFLSKSGLLALPLQSIDRAWVINENK